MYNIGDFVAYDNKVCVILRILPFGDDFILNIMTEQGDTFMVPSFKCEKRKGNAKYLVQELKKAVSEEQ